MKDIKKLAITALFTALTCVATMSIRIPTPGTGGYIHPGDALVILSGIYLGPVYGFFAAGVGSALSDLFGGYLLYAPITLAVKGLIALCTALAYKKIAANNTITLKYIGVVAGGIFDIIFVSGGYFLFEYVIYKSGAFASVIPNVIQGCGGLVISLLLYSALSAIPEFRKLGTVKQ
ncbi:MAG: ECF transporter S component [Hespellia sp.]|nr:ECF transporter S component [Hespellia sp.]